MRLQPPSLRPPEIVFVVYFLYVVAVAVFHPVKGVLPRFAIVNLLIVGGYARLGAPAGQSATARDGFARLAAGGPDHPCPNTSGSAARCWSWRS